VKTVETVTVTVVAAVVNCTSRILSVPLGFNTPVQEDLKGSVSAPLSRVVAVAVVAAG
jgi:hypothetical protein